MLQTISVAGVCIEFRGSPSDRELLERRYGTFQIPKSDNRCPPVEIHLDLSPPPSQVWKGQELDIEIGPEEFTLSGEGLSATIANCGMWVRLWAPRVDRAVDAVLRYVLARRLLERGGILVHASSVIIEGRAWVFAGASGVGKSTLGENLQGELLGDEAIALLVENGKVVAHATPYWLSRPGSAEVAALVFPDQGEANQWQTLSPGQATCKLASCAGPLLPSASEALLSSADQIIACLGPHTAKITLSSISSIREWLQPAISRY